jgi:glutamate/tyrosine decarboxylase-like PLP-dependent enzyme
VYVFYAGDDVLQVAQEAYGMFMSENGLGMMRAFPSLRQMEQDIIAIVLDLLHGGEDAVGNMTSGCTESIFMALKTARDWARDQRPHIHHPEIVIPYSAHPAFDKAGHYLDVQVRRVPVREDLRADPGAMAAAWAVLHYLGEEGYCAKAETIMRTRQGIESGIKAIDGLHVWGKPDLGLIAYGSEEVDIVAVANGMRQVGWFVVQIHQPKGLHLMLTPAHASIVDPYLEDLATVVAGVKTGAVFATGTEARYA